MEVNVIHNQAEYRAALRAIAPFFDAEEDVQPGTPEADRFMLLSMAIEAYEKVHYPSELPDPIAAIKFRMEQGNLTATDLIPHIGARNRVHEVLNKRRALTLPMIRNLSTLGIPERVLIQKYPLVAPTAIERKQSMQRVAKRAARKMANTESEWKKAAVKSAPKKSAPKKPTRYELTAHMSAGKAKSS